MAATIPLGPSEAPATPLGNLKYAKSQVNAGKTKKYLTTIMQKVDLKTFVNNIGSDQQSQNGSARQWRTSIRLHSQSNLYAQKFTTVGKSGGTV